MFEADGLVLLTALVKFASTLLAMIAAGSALTLAGLSRLSWHAADATRQFAVLTAFGAGLAAAALIPLRVWFLMGGSLAEANEPQVLALVLESPLGQTVQLRLIGLAMVAALLLNTLLTRSMSVLGALVICASFALSGHTVRDPREIMAILITLHFAAVAFWIGGFRPLSQMALGPPELAGLAAREFGWLAVLAVAVLGGTGAVLFLILAGEPEPALETAYGQTLALKVGLVMLLVLIGAWNKLILTPALLRGAPDAGGRLRASIRLEWRLALAVVLLTAVVTTTMAPPAP